jgi:Periplasmic copper-binding protein (NosD)
MDDAVDHCGDVPAHPDDEPSRNVQEGIVVAASGTTPQATLNRITANNNGIYGVDVYRSHATVANSVMSNNKQAGLTIVNFGTIWVAKSVISGNSRGVELGGGTVNSYGDNYINDNTTPVFGGSLTRVTTQ